MMEARSGMMSQSLNGAKSRKALSYWLAMLLVAGVAGQVGAQESGPIGKPGALIDITGNWVPVITQDWNLRVVTPPKGEYARFAPFNAKGKALADQWDPTARVPEAELCRTFGAPVITRLPGRMRISWQDDLTLKLDFEAGKQSRLIHFIDAAEVPLVPPGAPSWQGYSTAEWYYQRMGRGFGANGTEYNPGGPGKGGAMKVTTRNLRPGFLSGNGIPYSDRTVVTEYFRTFKTPDGMDWIVITNVVNDPVYLRLPHVTSVQFKREGSGAPWNPWPCEYVPPLQNGDTVYGGVK